MWLSGAKPTSEYWVSDLNIKINNADDVVDVSSFLLNGGNMKTASDLWSFTFLYRFGGLYCDTDAVAISHFPDDEWILCSCDPNSTHGKEKLSIGVIAAPPQQRVFLNCIDNIKHDWGNVTVFGDEYEKIYGNSNSTHDDKLFYPFPYYEWKTLLTGAGIPHVYSVHLYHSMFERNNMVLGRGEYDTNSMLGKIIEKFDSNL